MSPLFTLHGHMRPNGRPPPRSHGCAESGAEGGSLGRGEEQEEEKRRRRGRDYKLARMGWGVGREGERGGEKRSREKNATSQNKEQRLH